MARYKMYTGVPSIVKLMKSVWFSLQEITAVTRLQRQSIYNMLNGWNKTRKKEWMNVTAAKKLLKEIELKADTLRGIIYKTDPKKNISQSCEE